MKHSHIWATGVLTALLVGGSIHEGLAQRRLNTRFVPYSEVAIGGGSAHYYGDLAGYRRALRATYILPRWNVGASFTRHLSPRWSARASFTWARIVGDDYTFNKDNPSGRNAPLFVRNLHFRNDLKEFAITGIYNLVEEGRTSNYRPKIVPYLFAGIALLAHSPEARTPVTQTDINTAERQWVKLQPLGTEGQGQPGERDPYSLVQPVVPLGIGVRYKLNENWNVGAEIGWRLTFTDYLDDVGGDYRPVPQGTLNNLMADRRLEDIAARVQADRRPILDQLGSTTEILQNPEYRVRGIRGRMQDSYLLTHFTISYVIPGKIKCPPIK